MSYFICAPAASSRSVAVLHWAIIAHSCTFHQSMHCHYHDRSRARCRPATPDDGKTYLSEAFEECGKPGGVQLTLMPFAVVGLLFYVAGYPAMVLFVLRRNRQVVNEDQYLRCLDAMPLKGTWQLTLRMAMQRTYNQFKPTTYAWVIMIIARKFSLAFAGLLFNRNPPFQLAFCLLVLFLAFAAQLRYRPFMPPSDYNAVLEDLELRAAKKELLAVRVRAAVLSTLSQQVRKRSSSNNITTGADSSFIGSGAHSAMRSKTRTALLLTDFNVVESILLFSAAMVCLLGIMYDSLTARTNLNERYYTTARNSVTWGLMALIIISALFYLAALLMDLTVQRNARRAASSAAAASASRKARRAAKAIAGAPATRTAADRFRAIAAGREASGASKQQSGEMTMSGGGGGSGSPSAATNPLFMKPSRQQLVGAGRGAGGRPGVRVAGAGASGADAGGSHGGAGGHGGRRPSSAAEAYELATLEVIEAATEHAEIPSAAMWNAVRQELAAIAREKRQAISGEAARVQFGSGDRRTAGYEALGSPGAAATANPLALRAISSKLSYLDQHDAAIIGSASYGGGGGMEAALAAVPDEPEAPTAEELATIAVVEAATEHAEMPSAELWAAARQQLAVLAQERTRLTGEVKRVKMGNKQTAGHGALAAAGTAASASALGSTSASLRSKSSQISHLANSGASASASALNIGASADDGEAGSSEEELATLAVIEAATAAGEMPSPELWATVRQQLASLSREKAHLSGEMKRVKLAEKRTAGRGALGAAVAAEQATAMTVTSHRLASSRLTQLADAVGDAGTSALARTAVQVGGKVVLREFEPTRLGDSGSGAAGGIGSAGSVSRRVLGMGTGNAGGSYQDSSASAAAAASGLEADDLGARWLAISSGADDASSAAMGTPAHAAAGASQAGSSAPSAAVLAGLAAFKHPGKSASGVRVRRAGH